MGSRKRQPAPPPAPDPRQIAQTDVDFNRIDQFTPGGSLTFSGPNRNRADLTLSPELQGLFEGQVSLDQGLQQAAQGAIPGIQGLIQQPISFQGLPETQFDLGGQPQLQDLDFSGAAALPESADAFRDDVTNQFFDRSSDLLNRQFDRQEDRLRNRLANQGFQAGSEGFSQEIGDQDIQRNEAFSRLANDAVLFGGQEASRALGDTLALRGTGTAENQALTGFANQNQQQDFQNRAFQQDRQNAARSQLFNEQLTQRGTQFNELGSLLGLQQVQQPGLQNFFGPAQANVTDAFGLQQNQLQNNFNTQSRAASSAKGAGASLLGNVGGAFLGGKGR